MTFANISMHVFPSFLCSGETILIRSFSSGYAYVIQWKRIIYFKRTSVADVIYTQIKSRKTFWWLTTKADRIECMTATEITGTGTFIEKSQRYGWWWKNSEKNPENVTVITHGVFHFLSHSHSQYYLLFITIQIQWD